MTAALLAVVAALVVPALVVGEASRPLTTGRLLRTPPPSLPPGTRKAAGVLMAVGLGVLAPPLLVLAALGWWGVPRVHARRRQLEHQRAVRHALPDLVDLLQLATTAGVALPIALPLVAPHTPAPVGPALHAAHRAAVRGRPRTDALVESLAPLGDRAHALAHVLGDHLRYGVPLLPGLERTGLELRLERRRAAELEARRVPVRLLAPLTTCVLPAFALLTVVPLLVASLEALPL